MSQNQHLYGIFTWTMSQESAKKESTLSNRLNACERYLPDLFKHINEKLDEFDGGDRLDAKSFQHIFRYMLCFDRIGLWNPLIDGDPSQPDMEKDRLLSNNGEYTADEYLNNDDISHHDLDDVQKLLVNLKSKKGKLGISIYRLAQITFAVAREFMVTEEIYTIKKNEKKKIFDGEYDETFLKLAQKYHAGKSTSSSKVKKKVSEKQSDNEKSEETNDEVPTLEAFEAGEIAPSDVEDTELLETWYEQVDGRGRKSAITREVNKRKQKQEN